MEPSVGIGHGETPQPSSPVAPDYVPVPVATEPGLPARLRAEPTIAAQDWQQPVTPGGGSTAAAAVGLILGVGLAAVEIIKRLG